MKQSFEQIFLSKLDSESIIKACEEDESILQSYFYKVRYNNNLKEKIELTMSLPFSDTQKFDILNSLESDFDKLYIAITIKDEKIRTNIYNSLKNKDAKDILRSVDPSDNEQLEKVCELIHKIKILDTKNTIHKVIEDTLGTLDENNNKSLTGIDDEKREYNKTISTMFNLSRGNFKTLSNEELDVLKNKK